MHAQQSIPASKDAREARPMAPDADIPFVPWAHLAVLNAFYRRRPALEATLAGRPVTIATTSPTRGDDVTDRYVVDLKIDAAEGESCVPRRLLDALIATVDRTLSLDRLGARFKTIVIEFVLSEVLAAVETGVGCRLSLVTIHPERLGRANGERVASGLAEVLDRVAPTALPRSSIIVSDERLSSETNYRTEFVAVLSNHPQGGFVTRERTGDIRYPLCRR